MKLLIGHRDVARIEDLSYRMDTEGHRVYGASTAGAFWTQWQTSDFDIGIVELSFIDGAEGSGREATHAVPLIGLIERADERRTALALNRFCDAVLDQAVSFEVLSAQIRALMRRTGHEERTRPQGLSEGCNLTVGVFTFDLMTDHCKISGKTVPMTPKERKLLHYLAAAGGRVVSRRELFDRIWMAIPGENEHSIDVHIRYLRRRFEAAELADPVETCRGSGYALAGSYRIPDATH